MSKLLDNQVGTQNENLKKKSSGVHGSPHKGCDENKEINKQRRKSNYHTKFSERKDIIRLYQKTGRTNFDELWVTDSTLNEGTNCVVDELIGTGRMVRHA